jgi:hypothetical protein
MSLSNTDICYKCDLGFADLDCPIKCDGCKLSTHNKSSGLTVSEIKCLTLKNRSLKFFCEACNNGLRDIPELKLLINQLLAEVNDLKIQKNTYNTSNNSEEFIINEISERNLRASNLILYNVPESNSDNTTDRIAQDSNLVCNLINSINSGNNNIIKPLKVIRLGNRDKNNTRPIKAIFASPADAFDILKSKKKLLSLQPPSIIRISSDCTLHQRNYMKKLRCELETRRTNGEADLIIKYVRGLPKIVTKDNRPTNFRDENFL